MKHKVYICEDYIINGNKYFIYNPTELKYVQDLNEFKELIEFLTYNSIIAPTLNNSDTSEIWIIEDKQVWLSR